MEVTQHPKWTRLSEEFLVESIRNHKCLWDHTDERYMKKGLKTTAYNTITCDLRDSFPELNTITAAHVRTKYNNLRAYFMREYRKVQKTPSGAAGQYTSKWELFDAMSFLKDTLNNYTTKASASFTAEANVSVDTCSIVIHEDVTQKPHIVSPSSSSTPSPLYFSSSSPSDPSHNPSPTFCEHGSTLRQTPSPVPGTSSMSATGIPPVHSFRQTTRSKPKRRSNNDMSQLEEDCREALESIKKAEDQDDFSSSFGRMVTHWMRELPAGARMSAAWNIMEVMKNFSSR